MTVLHPAFDWREVARLVLASRAVDLLQEEELAPRGLVTYQFSARGHELGQVLLSQLLDRPFDAAGVYYRSRPFLLGVGLTVEEAMASDMARPGGVSAGRDVGVVFNLPRRQRATVLPMGGDVGSQFTPAAGWAQAIRYRVEVLGQSELDGNMVAVFGGDGSVATNGFWSCLTMATTLRLPLLFVVEDNGYAISVRRDLQTPGGNIAANLASFGNLAIWQGSGTQPAETADLVATAVEHVRSGQGPGLLRLVVPRLSGHSGHDNQAYKPEALLADERSRDPLPALRDYLAPALLSPADWEALCQEVETAVAAAAKAAQAQPPPDPAGVERYLFAVPGEGQQVGGLAAEGITLPATEPVSRPDEPRRINMVDAIRQTLDVELATNPRCLLFGEDVAEKGGVHTATMGLMAGHGPGRVFDTSLSEEGIIGRAVGLALAGLAPVAEIQFRKYADPATEQLNNCGMLRWRTANRFAAPLVVRIPVGFGRKIGDPWHSVTNEAFFAHAPGWLLAFPADAEDAVGLLRTALRGNDPVIFFEHRALLDAAWARRPYPGDHYAIPFGQARLLAEGDDLTVVTWGAMVERCEAAAGAVGAAVELIDLRTIVPWDRETVLASVRKTSKCLIVHEDIGPAGFGAEIAATIAQEAFLDLDGPIERLATPAVPIPFNPALMDAVVPTVERIRQKMEELLAF
ncbi:MAG: thiamine pyrophosphate-dependent enzyme [Chloroflexi bacterium]|nr:thiamine pyrophosphate-dependent enzyme [Chloroflexota bacterium]MCI0576200.1 thiamine pyrophosphate-dependent enzyme [Chloroflexota bacterium]MCI0645506.1 thiamine pyrophosphate-dependent enzyme [Chloroflexota bacterium]MCI0730645.1 thiamine pyrophosphate-dependent enzyme [Chloroflexota bacterium]